MKKVEQYFIYLLIIMFSVGIVGYAIPSTYDFVHSTTEFFLWFTGLTTLTLSILRVKKRVKYIVLIVITAALTIFIEIVGVKTGLIFGEYEYSNLFKFTAFEVPVIIGINWVIALLASYSLSQRITKVRFFSLLFVPLFIFAFDFVLEPVAIALNYWTWPGNKVPIENYIAWASIGFVFSLVLELMKTHVKFPILERLFLIQAAFFIILYYLVL
jgi:putative membrane protein